MIICRSPLRISLGGGGTDLPSYYQEHGGFLISAAIDKYVYVNVMRPFSAGVFLKYSQIESVDKIEDIKHPIIRHALELMGCGSPQIEITTFADIPAGTGLGSSGSFTTALLGALHSYRRLNVDKVQLAEMACDIEINRMGEPIGKQDQYISAFGGVTSFEFQTSGSVVVKPLSLNQEFIYELEDSLLLFFTGFTRSAGSILSDQHLKSIGKDENMIQNLNYVKDLGFKSLDSLMAGDIYGFGKIMNEHWEHKKQRSANMSNPKIDEWYKLAIANGAVGGKVVGAGGGGFLMFLANDRRKLRETMKSAGLEEVRFRFDFEGTKVLM